MTGQDNARARRLIVFLLMATFVVIGSTILWQKLNEPMQPIIIEMGDRYQVRWGNRFRPFVYEQLKETEHDETLEFVAIAGVEHDLSEETKNKLIWQGRMILYAHLYPEMFHEARAERWRAIFILFI